MAAAWPAWGYNYGYSYSNPYYVAPATTAFYDYSQPIVVNTYEAPATDEPTQESPETTAAYGPFDQARQAFMTGDYRTALKLTEQAIQKTPNDPVLHEFAGLCLFALGDYGQAAAVLNALLAVAPGMDWTTLSSLYPNVETYTTQLRALEAYSRANPNDAASHFVLAYHYLVTGHQEAAIGQLRTVTQLQPSDTVAKRMLEALSPAPQSPAVEPTPAAPAKASPSTDLVGQWRAERNGDRFELTISADSQFVWKATPQGKPPVTVSGQMVATRETLVLESKDQGAMVARVASGGPDRFQFVTSGAPPDDPGLTFTRQMPADQPNR